ncbi:tripartite tricarboxylate transporter TctB family protein [Kocuria coralli]|uniref:Tripartite tricarboxylate transporter TctB family protein n=2 Tax=Kocuria coralli TaxID=1461025 RepID=A0A5J5KUA0_9MICC|nr:tripartite tricarboxylate transporter TctB family protein [Kocuria coralli]
MVTMPVGEDTDFPGPRFYPMLLAIVGYLLALLLVLEILRKPEHPEQDEVEYRFYSDWKAVAWLVGGFLIFAVGIEFLGWIVAGALLFWCVARGVGSKRPIFDLSLALVFSSLIYLGFAVGLGLNLPSGLLGGL